MNKQLTLGADFDGADYNPELDKVRLTGQMKRIWNVMKSGRWMTLKGIEEITGDPQASISAQLRCFRKKKFGGFTVERERVEDSGLYRYRLNTTGVNVEVILEDGKPRKLPKVQNQVASEEEVRKEILDLYHWFNCDWNAFHLFLAEVENEVNHDG